MRSADALASRWIATTLAALAALFALAAAPDALRAQGRVALLIGNADYQNPALDLRNPANDAEALAAVLRDLGFVATVLLDADRKAAEAALDGFAADAAGAEIALIFFAGHGVQVAGENYLLTSGLSAIDPAELEREAITLGEIRARLLRARPEVGIVILDACRNSPFAERGLAPAGLARSQGGAGILIAYATDPGGVAYDGTGANSVFTEALIEHLAAPGVEARLMFGRVRQQVALASGGLQVPWVEESVLGEHYFNPTPRTGAPETAMARDVALWRSASAAGDRAAYQDYLAAFPDGLFAVFAGERIAHLEGAEAPAGDPAALLAHADRPQLVAALATLGFLSAPRGQAPTDRPPTDEELTAAIAGYGRQMRSGAPDLDALYLDSAQVLVMLGASTAQRIRTDMAALASIETTRAVAARARTELAALADRDPAAATALTTADGDIAAIEAARSRVLDRLDESRSYYAELLERGQAGLGPYLDRSLAGLLEKSRGIPVFEQRVIEDAGLFIRHATGAGTRMPEGSYAWLADFLPRS